MQFKVEIQQQLHCYVHINMMWYAEKQTLNYIISQKPVEIPKKKNHKISTGGRAGGGNDSAAATMDNEKRGRDNEEEKSHGLQRANERERQDDRGR